MATATVEVEIELHPSLSFLSLKGILDQFFNIKNNNILTVWGNGVARMCYPLVW